MKKFNEPTNSNHLSSTLARANSVSRNSTTSTNHRTSDSSDAGLASSSTTANAPPTSQSKTRRRFGLRSKPTDRQRTLSPTGAAVDVEQLGRGPSRLMRANFLKGRSMSSNSNTPDGLLDRFNNESGGSSSAILVGKKRLNLNGFLSSHHLGGAGRHSDQQASSASRSGLSRSTSANKVQANGAAQSPSAIDRASKSRWP